MAWKHTPTACALALGFALPLASGAAFAQKACPDSAYGDIDTSGNGILSEDEFTGYGAQSFSTWDENGDGVLSKEEFATCAPAAWGTTDSTESDKLFADFDRNDDGSLSEDEFFDQQTYAALDANDNGEVDQEELYGEF